MPLGRGISHDPPRSEGGASRPPRKKDLALLINSYRSNNSKRGVNINQITAQSSSVNQ